MRFLQMQVVLDVLQSIEPGLNELKINRKETASKYLELIKVFKNHTRSSDYIHYTICQEPFV